MYFKSVLQVILYSNNDCLAAEPVGLHASNNWPRYLGALLNYIRKPENGKRARAWPILQSRFHAASGANSGCANGIWKTSIVLRQYTVLVQ